MARPPIHTPEAQREGMPPHRNMNNSACHVSASARVEGCVAGGGGWKARGGLCGVQTSAAYLHMSEQTCATACRGANYKPVCALEEPKSHGAVARVEIWVGRSGEWKTCGGV